MASYKDIVFDTLKANLDIPMYKKAWENIQLLGENSKSVDTWLSPFENCKDEMDFILAYECGFFPPKG